MFWQIHYLISNLLTLLKIQLNHENINYFTTLRLRKLSTAGDNPEECGEVFVVVLLQPVDGVRKEGEQTQQPVEQPPLE